MDFEKWFELNRWWHFPPCSEADMKAAYEAGIQEGLRISGQMWPTAGACQSGHQSDTMEPAGKN